LARAIVHEPRLLLLDETLSNLDAQLRDEMRGELKRMQSKIGITTVYVTHDQSEALALSDRIAVIDQGRITQIGSTQDIYFRPTTRCCSCSHRSAPSPCPGGQHSDIDPPPGRAAPAMAAEETTRGEVTWLRRSTKPSRLRRGKASPG